MTGPALVGLFVVIGFGCWQAPSVPVVRPARARTTARTTARTPAPANAKAIAGGAVALLGVGAGLWLWPLAASFVVAVVLTGARLRRRRRREASRAEAVAALPEALELCIVTLSAGGTVADCLRSLALSGADPARSAAAASLLLVGDGALLGDALFAFQGELGPSYQPLSGALRLATEQGGSIGALLDRLAMEARAERRRSGELRARRLSVLLVVPLVAFSLPAVLIGVLVPLALVALRHVS